MGRQRADRLVVERGLAPTREQARRLILAGEVLADDEPVEKPGSLVRDDTSLRLRHPRKPYVGRGGEKLQGALEAFSLDVRGLVALDVGASTGGFTDCLLRYGARSVTALDVGKGQLDWKLYSDPRVRVVEGKNARYLNPGDLDLRFDIVTVDVSFISLTKVLPALIPLVNDQGLILALVKPQFELSPEAIERGGLVTVKEHQVQAIVNVAIRASELGLAVRDVVDAPIKGVKGNQEFFLLAQKSPRRGLEPRAIEERSRRIVGMSS
ncbi:MAG TPA: TlyA family RNA methyltransferase [Vicinamibacteria bacterium]|nr:TlyA family RNA methyltransferase [Vicinamibacteria bacterium]